MAIAKRGVLFYVSVLATGFVLGGFLSSLLKRFLPEGPAKEFFTWTVTPSIGPFSLDLIIFSITLGPLVLQVSLLGSWGSCSRICSRDLCSSRKAHVAFGKVGGPVFGNLGVPELLVIMGIALLVFGAKRLPEIGSSLGKGIREFKSSIKEVKDSIDEADNSPPSSRRIDAPSSVGEASSHREGEPKKLSE